MLQQNPTGMMFTLVAAVGLTAGGVGHCVWTSLHRAERRDGQVAQIRAASIQVAHAAQHGGQVSCTDNYCFEVVYQPRGARVYLYDRDHRHLSARGVTGEVSLQLTGTDKVFRLPVRYAAGQAASQHDYLAVDGDFNGIHDCDMRVTIALDHLPNARQRTAEFAQVFRFLCPMSRSPN